MIILSEEAANAIESCEAQGTTGRMVALVAENDPLGYERYPELMGVGLYTLMGALVNGYKVEEYNGRETIT